MLKKVLKLEFEYSVRNYTNENGVECRKTIVKPIGDMKQIFPEGHSGKMESLASESIRASLSFAAGNYKEAAENRAGNGVTFSEKVYFTDEDGTTLEITPETFTPR